jgi:cytochrome c5
LTDVRWLLPAFVFGAVLCAADDVSKPSVVPKPVVVPKTPEARIAKGKDLVDSICFWCHEPELMQTKQLNKQDWAELITPMIYEGAPVTRDEFDMIVEYLVKNFGPPEGDK